MRDVVPLDPALLRDRIPAEQQICALLAAHEILRLAHGYLSGGDEWVLVHRSQAALGELIARRIQRLGRPVHWDGQSYEVDVRNPLKPELFRKPLPNIPDGWVRTKK